MFYLYYYIILATLIFISNGIETLFTSTDKVIKYHNYPDILKISSIIYNNHSLLKRFLYAGYSGLICLSNFYIIMIIIFLYKYTKVSYYNIYSYKYIIIFFIMYIIFIILNGLNILSFYNNDNYIGHKIIYFCIPLISLYYLFII